MNRETYLKHRATIRANGARYSLPRIACPLEREYMSQLEQPSRDHLHQRMAWMKLATENPIVAFKCTTPFRKLGNGDVIRW